MPHRISSRAALVAAFPSVDPRKIGLARRAWKTEVHKLAAFVALHAPLTDAWLRQCLHAPHTMAVRRSACDELLGMHGVERLGRHRKSGASVYYCNAGDMYAVTLIFHDGNAYLACVGDLIERRTVREDAP